MNPTNTESNSSTVPKTRGDVPTAISFNATCRTRGGMEQAKISRVAQIHRRRIARTDFRSVMAWSPAIKPIPQGARAMNGIVRARPIPETQMAATPGSMT